MKAEIHEANRLSWNAATVAHNSHKGDQAAFFRAGGNRLFAEERELLGDVAGLRIAHLQCNSGQDTLSLAQLGAEVVGVDISDEAIGFARRLSEDAGIAARFERADVYDWLDAAVGRGDRFDVVFASYGALCWLSDVRRWARAAAAVLQPGGRLVLVEFHPVASMFDAEMRPTWPYSSGGEPIGVPPGVGDYVADARESLALTRFVAHHSVGHSGELSRIPETGRGVAPWPRPILDLPIPCAATGVVRAPSAPPPRGAPPPARPPTAPRGRA